MFKIKLKIQPNSSKNEIINCNNEIKVKLTAQPVDNKANKALVAFLAKFFHVSKTSVEILKGHTSKEKTILFNTIDEETFYKKVDIEK